MKKISRNFGSCSEYIKIYFKRIRQECWELIAKDYPEAKDRNQLASDLLFDSLNQLGDSTLRVLDAGCGHAPTIYVQNDNRINFIGTDLVFDDIRKNTSIDYGFICDLNEIPLEDESINVVVSNLVFEHLKDPETVFAEISRVLKNNGYLIFTTPSIYGIVTIINRMLPHRISQKLSNLLTCLNESDVFSTYYKVNSIPRLKRLTEQNKFIEKDIIMYQPPPYAFVFSKLICRIIIAYYNILNRYEILRPLRGVIIARYQKNDYSKQQH